MTLKGALGNSSISVDSSYIFTIGNEEKSIRFNPSGSYSIDFSVADRNLLWSSFGYPSGTPSLYSDNFAELGTVKDPWITGYINTVKTLRIENEDGLTIDTGKQSLNITSIGSPDGTSYIFNYALTFGQSPDFVSGSALYSTGTDPRTIGTKSNPFMHGYFEEIFGSKITKKLILHANTEDKVDYNASLVIDYNEEAIYPEGSIRYLGTEKRPFGDAHIQYLHNTIIDLPKLSGSLDAYSNAFIGLNEPMAAMYTMMPDDNPLLGAKLTDYSVINLKYFNEHVGSGGASDRLTTGTATVLSVEEDSKNENAYLEFVGPSGFDTHIGHNKPVYTVSSEFFHVGDAISFRPTGRESLSLSSGQMVNEETEAFVFRGKYKFEDGVDMSIDDGSIDGERES